MRKTGWVGATWRNTSNSLLNPCFAGGAFVGCVLQLQTSGKTHKASNSAGVWEVAGT